MQLTCDQTHAPFGTTGLPNGAIIGAMTSPRRRKGDSQQRRAGFGEGQAIGCITQYQSRLAHDRDPELYTVELPVKLRQIWTSHLFPLVAEPHDGVGGCGDLVPVGARKTPA